MNIRSTAVLGLLLAAVAPLGLADDDDDDGDQGKARYQVTVTNATHDQRFTPILVAAHDERVRLFAVGQPASVELATLAEEGNTAPLAALLAASRGVHGIATSSGLLEPGQTATVVVDGRSQDQISLAAMLIPTNDAFVAVSGARVSGRRPEMLSAVAYDAGSEVNDELCASIPGPGFDECGGPGGGGSPFGGEEGFVHVHRGIHGVGDIDPSRRDWRNPVARVTIVRIR